MKKMNLKNSLNSIYIPFLCFMLFLCFEGFCPNNLPIKFILNKTKPTGQSTKNHYFAFILFNANFINSSAFKFPSMSSLRIAKRRVKNLVCGYAEALPFKKESFDFALVVVSICFFDDVQMAFCEISRILKTEGKLIIGFVPRNTCLGEFYVFRGIGGHRFYRYAKFFTEDEVESIALLYGFKKIRTLYLFTDKGSAYLRERWNFRAKFAVMEFSKI